MPAPASQQPPMPAPSNQPEMGGEDIGIDDIPSDNMNQQDVNSNDDVNSFGKEKFDAGIDVDEDSDPKKYIEKLTGKLAQKLRDYNGTEQDIELNKFVINSLIPASVPQMDETEAKDVIKKVQDNIGKSGGDSGNNNNNNNEPNNESPELDDQNNQENLPPVPQQENVEDNIDDLINEVLGVKKFKNKTKSKNPFKSPKFK